MHVSTSFLYKEVMSQGVIQDFEIEGGTKKSNQNILLKKKVHCYFITLLVCKITSYGHSVIQLVPECKLWGGGGIGARGRIPPPPCMTPCITPCECPHPLHVHSVLYCIYCYTCSLSHTVLLSIERARGTPAKLWLLEAASLR